MVIGLVTARIHMPEARSLKDKRSVLRSVKDRLRQQINASIAEVGDQDVWQVASLAIVTVAANTEIVQSRLSEISTFLQRNPRYILLDLHTEFL